jgi:membrane protease YdiL (CAAX protease family)
MRHSLTRRERRCGDQQGHSITTTSFSTGWWVVAQGLLGVGIARPTPVLVVAAAVGLVVIAVVEPTVRVAAAALAVVVGLVAVLPTCWPLPALLAGVVARSRFGRTRGTGWLVGAGAGLAAAAVVTPLVLPVLDGAPLAFLVPRPPVVLLGAAVVGAAVLNALAEETLWRGAIVGTDRRLGFPPWTTAAAQAAGFGVAHWHGIPGGPIGVLAAGAFGALMAVVRLRIGFGAALLAHVLTDVAIFTTVAATAVFLPA